MTSSDPDPVQRFGFGAWLKRIVKHKVYLFYAHERMFIMFFFTNFVNKFHDFCKASDVNVFTFKVSYCDTLFFALALNVSKVKLSRVANAVEYCEDTG